MKSYSGSNIGTWYRYTRNNVQMSRYDIDAWTERTLNGERDGFLEGLS